ncbi:hemagglutinin repeat-containing protein [Acinetobacter populi]|uniref:Filamentous haemagglutinin FhaB/tRNA nuclease CdiA-like TPS domain-containing protein n=1 Tax=Acinetobacter populi TaxID=1582270 RepID=A0A1Z9YUP6_9GAMM|nr:hemagglutinin repeat-containing protein [Acinetobacter populi]OUY05879.1 hypothetical protein CAP51_14250 [Acinetobacter populi]
MNKNLYKVIFNKNRGQMVVVAENVVRKGKSAGDTSCSDANITATSTDISQRLFNSGFRLLSFSILLTLGSVLLVNNEQAMAADIKADPSAPGNQQATILQTANGIPQINIQTPSAAGVSMNQYQQMDVNSNGAILNNSRKNIQTELGGWIQGNPWLATGEAKVIVNQINSRDPSKLNGYIEVAGRKADVVIANPAGLQINGAGFINAGGITLTTGNPIIKNGGLDSYQIRTGQIAVEGKGLDGSTTDYTYLLTQAAQINAGIWAKELTVITGQNDIDTQGQHTAVTSSNHSSDSALQPTVAIDTSNLGGMYAGKIHLVSSDKGIGVNNAGQIFAGAGGVQIDANGYLSNSGSIVASDNNQNDVDIAAVTIQATDISNSGTVSGQGNTSIQSDHLSNSGLINSNLELKLYHQDSLENSGTIKAGRLDIESGTIQNQKGEIVQTGLQHLALTVAGHLSNDQGGVIGIVETSSGSGGSGSNDGQNNENTETAPSTSIGGGSTTTTTIDNTLTSLPDGQIVSHHDLNNNGGQITANGGIDLDTENGLSNHGTMTLGNLNVTGSLLDNSQGNLSVDRLISDTDDFSNEQGKLQVQDTTQITTKTFNNVQGEIQSVGAISIETATASNQQGEMSSSSTITLNSQGQLDNQAGRIKANQAVNIGSNGLDNSDGQIVSVQESVNLQNNYAQFLNQSGKILATQDINIQTGDLNNQEGIIHADQIQIDAGSAVINNRLGDIQSQTDINIKSGSLENVEGQIVASRNVTINTQQQQLNNQQGILAAAENMDVQSGILLNQQGQIVANSNLNIDTAGQGLNNENTQNSGGISADVLNIQSGDLNNNQGLINSHQASIESANLSNVNGKILANEVLQIVAQNINNQSGQIGAGNQLELSGQTVVNNQGLMNAKIANITATTLENQNTRSSDQGIQADQLRIQAKDLDNRQGQIIANQALPLTIDHYLNNQQGLIATASDLIIQSTSGYTLDIDNDEGVIQSGTELDVQAKALSNSGQILSNGNMTIDVEDNLQQTGTLATQGSLILNAAQVNNHGSIQAKDRLTSQSKNWNNDQGQIQANVIAFDSDAFSNVQGQVLQNGSTDLNINISGGLDNTQGVIGAKLAGAEPIVDPASIDQTTIDTNNTVVDNNTTINTTETIDTGYVGDTVTTEISGHFNISGVVNNQNGQIIGNGESYLQGQADLNNTQGEIVVKNLHWSNAQVVNNQNGQINSEQSRVSADDINNQQGQWVGVQNLDLTASQGIDNRSGQLLAGENLQLVAQNMQNQQGRLISSGTLTAQVKQALDNQDQGQISANQGLNIVTGDLNNNAGEISSSAAEVKINASGNISNQTGTITAADDLQLRGQSIDNRSGGISADIVTVTATTAGLNNQQGQITGNSLLIDSVGLNNQTGIIYSNGQLEINSQKNELDNRQGYIIGLNNTVIESGALNNQQGIIQSNADLNINTHQQKLDNQNTQDTMQGIVSQGILIITAGELNNQLGNILGQQLSSTVDTLQNQSGSIQSVGDLTVNAAAKINNQSGQLIAGQDILLQAQDIDNSSTGNDATQGIQAQQIRIESQNLYNTQGQVIASANADLLVAGNIDNQQGKISAVDRLSITGLDAQHASQYLSNQNGQLLASTLLNIKTTGLDNTLGQIKSQGQLDVVIGSDFQTAQGQLQAAGDATIQVVGTLNNTDQLQAGGKLNISSQHLNNAAEASINADETNIEVDGVLNNYGLIDGYTTYLKADQLNNVGGQAKLYGNYLAIQANQLNNDVDENGAATIAARERLDIGVTDLINREQGLIFSAGDLFIGGLLDDDHQAIGRAQSIYNSSARIESLGDMQLDSVALYNLNAHLDIQIQQIATEHIVEYEANGRDERLLEGTQESLGWKTFDDESEHLQTPDGKNHEQWHKYDYTRTTEESRVVETAPGQIIAGGNMTITADGLWNKDSQIIAGGQLTANIKADNLHNEETLGVRIITDEGTLHNYWRDKHKGTDTTGHSQSTYAPAAQITEGLSLGTMQYLQYSTVDGDSTQVDARQGIQVTTDIDQAEQSQRADAVGTTDLKQVDAEQLANQEKETQQSGDIAQVQTQDSLEQEGTTLQHAEGSTTDSSSAVEIRTLTPSTQIPGSSLFAINAEAGQPLIETDAKFTDYRKWLSSDYMLTALSLDPALQQKRMGDGFYEQRLINEQISKLTGQRYLEGYSNDEEQYKALMDSGISAAKAMNLVPGVALSAEQIARLTSDIVWLVSQNVTLADGSIQTVLVPQVYVKVRQGDIDGSGALLSGNITALNVTQNLENSGTIAGRQALQINAENVNNINGRLSAAKVAVNALQDINNVGGRIDAEQQLVLNAGRDINSVTTSSHNSNAQGEVTALNRIAGVYVTGQTDGILIAEAGRDVNLTGSIISNQSEQGQTLVKAGQNINLGTVSSSRYQENIQDANNYIIRGYQQDQGSRIESEGNLSLIAGQDLTAKAAEISSASGQLSVGAGRDIQLTTGQSNLVIDDASKHTGRSGGGNKVVETDKIHIEEQQSIASNLGGKTVVAQAGQDIVVQGSSIIADQDLAMVAGRDVRLESAEERYVNESEHSVKKSGLMSSGGIGFSVGSKKESTEQDNEDIIHSGSTVGSLSGNTNIIAGNQYSQKGSAVSAVEGDVNIQAAQIDIRAEEDRNSNRYRYEMEQKGLTVAVNVPVVNLVQGAVQSVKQVGQSGSDRVNAMASANAAFDSYKTAQSLSGLKDAVGAAKNASDAAKAANVSVSITYGEQKNSYENLSQSTSAAKSSVNAGGQVNLVATGAGEQSNINIIGSDVIGQQGTTLIADNDVNIRAAEQSSTEQSSNKNEGWNAGVAASYGKGGGAIGITAGGNAGKGHGDGTETSYVASTVGSSESQTTIQSGNASNIIGSVVQGKGVQVNAKALNIKSLQDTASYQSKQQNIEGQATIGLGGGASVSGSASKSNINANYASVQDQAGIFAGDDGYQINVQGNTDLKGALITSSALAEQSQKNSLSTGTLTYSDIQNVSEYDAKGLGVSASINTKGGWDGSGLDKDNKPVNNVSKSVGFGLDSGEDSSVTRSGINTSNITITDVAGQQALTGQSIEESKAGILTTISTETAKANSGAIANNFDKDKVQSEIDVQVAVTKKFGENAPKAVADYAQQQVLELQAAGNFEEAEKWKEGGIYRVAMHTAIGALSTGTVEGALTTGSVAIAAPTINQFEKNISQALAEKGMNAEAANIIANGVTSLTVAGAGIATGLDTGSTATAINVDSNNRQLHRDEIDLIKKLAKQYAEEKGISEDEANTLLTRGALYNIDEGWQENMNYNLSNADIAQYNEAYQYLLSQSKDMSVSELDTQLSGGYSQSFKTDADGSTLYQMNVLGVSAETYAGSLTEAEQTKAENYVNTAGQGFTATAEDFKNKDVFLLNTLAGSTVEGSDVYNDKKAYIEQYAAIKPEEVGFWERAGSSVDKEVNTVAGAVTGVVTGAVDTVKTGIELIEGAIDFLEHPIENSKKAADTAVEIATHLPELSTAAKDAALLAKEQYDTTIDLYRMQQDEGAEAEYKANLAGQVIGGGGIGSVGKTAAKETGKVIKEGLDNLEDTLSPKPATVAGTPDIGGGATTMTGKLDTDIGATEVTGGTIAAGSDGKETITVDYEQSKNKGTSENQLVNDLKPSTNYELSNGTKFTTNEHGYVEEILFIPKLEKVERDSRQTAVGKLGNDGDVGGHIQACSLGGTCDSYNLFPQNANFNSSAYKRWENEIRSALQNGDKVGEVKVSFDRSNPANIRPDSLVVEYNINGVNLRKTFDNESSK